MILRRFLILLLAAAATSPAAVSQDVTDHQDADACASSELDTFRALEGDWSVSGSVRRSDGEWEDVRGTAHFAVDLDGCVVIERYGDNRSAGPLSAIATYSYDSIDSRLQKTWVDSGHGATMLFRGGLVGEKTIVSARRDIRGTEHHFVEEYDFDGSDRFVHERRRAAADRTTWRATSRLVYERD
jgi:hypothetical protein